MLKNALIILLFLLGFNTAKAQYSGGKGDGHAIAEAANIILGTAEFPAINAAINIYPNPVSKKGKFTVASGEFYISGIYISDVFGLEKYKNDALFTKIINIDLSARHFPAGVYMVKIHCSNGKFLLQKLIIE